MINNLKIRKDIASFTLYAVLSSISLSGCVMNMESKCSNKNEKHAHLYTTEDNKFKTYRISELSTLPTSSDEGNVYWTKKTVPITDEIEVMQEFKLFRINDNYKYLSKKEKNYRENPKIEYQYEAISKYNNMKYYTTNPKKHLSQLTGFVRNIEYKYKGYKVIKKNGSNKLIASDYTDSLIDIKEEYPYFKLEDYKKKTYSPPYTNNKSKVKTK